MFDTLSCSEAFAGTGVLEDQTKLQAKVLSEALQSNDLATKADIVELESKMAEMELRIIKWQIGGIGLVIAAMKFL